MRDQKSWEKTETSSDEDKENDYEDWHVYYKLKKPMLAGDKKFLFRRSQNFVKYIRKYEYEQMYQLNQEITVREYLQ